MGRGNARLLAWEGDKVATFTFEDALISPMGFSILSGAGLIESSAVPMHYTVNVSPTVLTGEEDTKFNALVINGPVGSNFVDLLAYHGKVIYDDPFRPQALIFVYELDETGAIVKKIPVVSSNKELPEAEDKLYVYLKENRADGYTTDFMLVDVHKDGGGDPTPNTIPLLDERKTYLIDYYADIPGSDMEIEAGKFAGYYYVEANTLFRNKANGQDHAAQFTIPKGKIQSNFTFSLAATGEPSQKMGLAS